MIILKKKLFMVCLFFALIAGCAQRQEARTFLPLNPGNTWQYTVNVDGEKQRMQVEVGESREVEGYNAFSLSYSYQQLALPTQVEYYVPQENAVLFPRLDNVQGQYLKKPFQILLKFPLKKGEKWEWDGKLVPVGSKTPAVDARIQTEVTRVETVTVPAGTYKNAVRVSFSSVFNTGDTGFEVKEDRWYVKGIGMVKEVLYDEKGEEILVAVLNSFKKK